MSDVERTVPGPDAPGRASAAAAIDVLESAVRRDRLLVSLGIAAAMLVAWAYLVPAARDMYGDMDGLSAWMMTATWDARYFAMIFAMWSVMMLGMMLPSASPTILLFTRAVRSAPSPDAPVARAYAFAGGYLVAWVGFSLAATTLQALLARLALMSPMMETVSPVLGGALLVAAGVYQWTPYKHRCLTHCRSPIQWLSHHWRPGVAGALRMGVSHGLYCVGCCWAVMLLLFVGGVMNLTVIVVLTLFVLLEKLAPRGADFGRAGGVLLVAAGVWLLAR